MTRIDMSEAIELFRQNVLPALHELDDFEGTYALLNPEGKALVLTFWRTEEAAGTQIESGFYGEQLERHATIFRAPPGRAMYEVVFAEDPAAVDA